MSELRLMTKEDLATMALLEPDYAHLLRGVDPLAYDLSLALRRYGFLLAIGAFTCTQGVSQAWLIASDYGRRYPLALGLGVKRAMQMAYEQLRFHRLETRVHIDDERAQNFVEAFGFVLEGINRSFYENGDHAMLYAWVAPRKGVYGRRGRISRSGSTGQHCGPSAAVSDPAGHLTV